MTFYETPEVAYAASHEVGDLAIDFANAVEGIAPLGIGCAHEYTVGTSDQREYRVTLLRLQDDEADTDAEQE